MVQLTQKCKKNQKSKKNAKKCIDITLRKWSWRVSIGDPCDKWVKKGTFLESHKIHGPKVEVYREKFNIDFLTQFFPGFRSCIGTPTEILGEKTNVKFFKVDTYFWAMYFVGL